MNYCVSEQLVRRKVYLISAGIKVKHPFVCKRLTIVKGGAG